MIKVDKIDVNNVIIESIELVKSVFNQNFTKRQLDLILAVISLIDKNDTNLLWYEIPMSEIARIYNPANPRTAIVKEEIKKAVKGLMEACFYIDGKQDEEEVQDWYHWIERARIIHDRSVVQIKISEDVKQFYIQLHKQSLIYTLKYVLTLKTLMDARLYHWAYSKKGFKNAVPISIDDAKLYFYGKTDIKTTVFVKKYLEPSIRRINEQTDIRISYEKVYADKSNKQKISSLKFYIEKLYIQSLKTDEEIKFYEWAFENRWRDNDFVYTVDDIEKYFGGPDIDGLIDTINSKTDIHVSCKKVYSDDGNDDLVSFIFHIDYYNGKKASAARSTSTRSESQIKSDKERSKKMWQVVKDQAETIEKQEQIINSQNDTIRKISNENTIIKENELLKMENIKLKMSKNCAVSKKIAAI